MTRKFKAIGLAMIAVLAMSTVTASAAHAEGSAEVEGGGTATQMSTKLGFLVIKFGSVEVECEVATFSGEISNGATSFELHPEYTECEGGGFLEATVNTNSCRFKFTPGATSGTDQYAATFQIVNCPTTSPIIDHFGTCAVHIINQGPLNGVTTKNTTSATPKKDVDAIFNVTGISYTITEKGFLCPLTGNVGDTRTDATTSGDTTLQNTKPAGTFVGFSWFM